MAEFMMILNRKLKRVPLDFDWPLNKVWYGYRINLCEDDHCDDCKKFAQIMGYKESFGCPDFPLFNPPIGKGFQCWETTSEGSPISPVFKSLDELSIWLSKNTDSHITKNMTKENWVDALMDTCPTLDMKDLSLVK